MKRLLLLFFLLFLFSCESNFSTEWYKRGYLNYRGKKQFVVAANFPYFSYYPHSTIEGSDLKIWKDLLFQIKSTGINTLYLSIPWVFHQTEQDAPDFLNGKRNLYSLLRVSEEMNFITILNISPQSIENLTGGGLPSWLQRYLYYMPLDGDGKVAVRTTDSDFQNIFLSYAGNLLNILFPFLYLPQNSGSIFEIQFEGKIQRLKSAWLETWSYLGIPFSPKMIQEYKNDIIKSFQTKFPDITFAIEEKNIFSNNTEIVSGNRVSRCNCGGIKPIFFKLASSNPYEIITASVAGFAGVILPHFTTTLYPEDLQGWRRKNYPEGATDINIQPPLENNLISIYSPPEVTAAEIKLVSEWLNEGYFPERCRITKWEVLPTHRDYLSDNNSWWNYIETETEPQISREWKCRDNFLEITYSDKNGPDVRVYSEDNLPIVTMKGCKILYAGENSSSVYFIAEDSKRCSITAEGEIKIIPDQWGKRELSNIRFYTDTLIIISPEREEKKIAIYGFPSKRIRHISLLPQMNLLLKGIDYATHYGENLQIMGEKEGVIQKIDKIYPVTITTISFSTETTSFTPTSVYTLNEKIFSTEYNPINNAEWMEGKAFKDYFSSSPYNYTSGFYRVYIPFKNSYGGNGYIKLPSAGGLFNIFLNGNFLGTILAYGEDVTIPFNNKQIKIGNNYITALALPTGTFPFEDPLYINHIPEKFLQFSPYLTLFNFYHRPGFQGQGLVKIGENFITLNGKWYFFRGLIGEKEKLYDNNVNSIWQIKNLPLSISSGSVTWIKNFIHIPENGENWICKIEFYGENIFIRTYINGKMSGNLIPSSFTSYPLKIKGNFGTIELPVGKNQELTIAAAIISVGKSRGKLEKIKITLSKKEDFKWISVRH